MYRIQKRMWSSDIIKEGIKKGDKIHWKPLLIPVCNKEKGDLLCDLILYDFLPRK